MSSAFPGPIFYYIVIFENYQLFASLVRLGLFCFNIASPPVSKPRAPNRKRGVNCHVIPVSAEHVTPLRSVPPRYTMPRHGVSGVHGA